MPLIEKAWAKLFGRYSIATGIDGGLPYESLVIL